MTYPERRDAALRRPIRASVRVTEAATMENLRDLRRALDRLRTLAGAEVRKAMEESEA